MERGEGDHNTPSSCLLKKKGLGRKRIDAGLLLVQQKTTKEGNQHNCPYNTGGSTQQQTSKQKYTQCKIAK